MSSKRRESRAPRRERRQWGRRRRLGGTSGVVALAPRNLEGMNSPADLDEEIPTPLRKEVGPFVIIGISAVALDFLLFNVLLWVGWPVWLANGVALIVSMTLSFVGNYKWTFAHREIKSLWHAYGTFTSINVLSLLFVEVAVVGAEQFSGNGLFLNVIKAVATAIATVARFFAYKRWVFF